MLGVWGVRRGVQLRAQPSAVLVRPPSRASLARPAAGIQPSPLGAEEELADLVPCNPTESALMGLAVRKDRLLIVRRPEDVVCHCIGDARALVVVGVFPPHGLPAKRRITPI